MLSNIFIILSRFELFDLNLFCLLVFGIERVECGVILYKN